MSVRQCIGQIHEWRWWGLERCDPKSGRLSYIERKIPDFMGRTEIASERANLVRSICNTRLDKVVGRILRSSALNASLRTLEADKQKLAHFLEKKDDASFQQLPPEMQDSFRRALKIQGETDIELIHQIQTPLIFLKGETLGDQMLHYYEMLYLLEQQTNVVQESPHSREQKEMLAGMQKIKETEEFDRLTLLFTKIDRHEWHGFVHRASPKVREWIQILETEWAKKQHLRSDGRYLYQWRGAQSEIDAARFQVYAPHARQVKLLLTAYGREEHCIPMERKGYGVFEVRTHHAFPGRTYRYLVEDCHGQWRARTDPFGMSVIEKNGIVESIITDREAFGWNDQNWMHERKRAAPPKSRVPFTNYMSIPGKKRMAIHCIFTSLPIKSSIIRKKFLSLTFNYMGSSITKMITLGATRPTVFLLPIAGLAMPMISNFLSICAIKIRSASSSIGFPPTTNTIIMETVPNRCMSLMEQTSSAPNIPIGERCFSTSIKEKRAVFFSQALYTG